MAICRDKVVLCKSLTEAKDGQDSYEKTLQSAGYECVCLQTLRFEFVNIAKLRERLLTSAPYCGLILTSRRAVEAIDLASKEDKDILLPWKTLPVYCVGPATQSLAKDQLGLDNCLGSQSGNAKELANRIILDVVSESKSLLYPCSEIARDTVEQILTNKGINLERLVVYRTLPNESLENDLLKIVDDKSKIFVFFSPSSVEYVLSVIKKHSISMELVKMVAIGPVTERNLVEAGLRVDATASKPEPAALLDALVQIKTDMPS